MRTEFF